MVSQSPFSSCHGQRLRHAAFHPAGRPQLFAASARAVRIFDLVRQQELRCLRLDTAGDQLSSMALHPSGECCRPGELARNVGGIVIFCVSQFLRVVKAELDDGVGRHATQKVFSAAL